MGGAYPQVTGDQASYPRGTIRLSPIEPSKLGVGVGDTLASAWCSSLDSWGVLKREPVCHLHIGSPQGTSSFGVM